MNLKQINILAIIIIALLSCTKPSEQNKSMETSSDTVLHNEKVKIPDNAKKRIKSVQGKGLKLPEFNINGDKVEIKYNNGKPIEINSFIFTNNQFTLYRQVQLEYSGAKIEKEKRSYYDGDAIEKSILSYSPFKNSFYRSTANGNVTDIKTDSSGNISIRIQYENSDAKNAIFYYEVRRNEKGNETESLLVTGETDAQVTKSVYEYLEFDEEGNWTKRKKRTDFEVYEFDTFQDHFKRKKRIPSLEFPIKISEKPKEEETEERTIEYETVQENISSATTANPGKIVFENFCSPSLNLCLDLPKGVFIYKGNQSQTSRGDDFETEDKSGYLGCHLSQDQINYLKNDHTLQESLEADKKMYVEDNRTIDSSAVEKNSYFIKSKSPEEKKYYIKKIILSKGDAYSILLTYPEDKKETFDKVVPRILQSIQIKQ